MSRVSSPPPREWIVSPWFDMLFVANLIWPVYFLLAYASDGFEGQAGVRFWQIYFVTTPHRWITLFVVFLDRDRLQERSAVFVGLALLAVGACSVTFLTTGGLTCLLAIDYAWNAWHFAAQHHGVYRLYRRGANASQSLWLVWEKILMRTFLLYVTARVAGGAWSNPGLEEWLLRTDWAILGLPCLLLLMETRHSRFLIRGSCVYLLSVCVLYACLLWSVHAVQPRVLLALTTASALFHATEYLVLISWSVRQRQRTYGTQLGWLYWFASRWGIVLLIYVTVLGIGGWFIEQQWLEVWLLINVIMAFLHYAFDGIIWRRPRSRSTPIPVSQVS